MEILGKFALHLDWRLSYLVEEQNEVDGKTHKQGQEAEVIEVTSQVVLWGKKFHSKTNYW